jgi:hypothetical protein
MMSQSAPPKTRTASTFHWHVRVHYIGLKALGKFTGYY